jgi:hypothetical protein
MLMLLTSILVFLPVMMYCIPVVLFLLQRTVVVLAACMMVVAVQSAFLVCFPLLPLSPLSAFPIPYCFSQNCDFLYKILNVVFAFTLICARAGDSYPSDYGANKDNYDDCCHHRHRDVVLSVQQAVQ